MRVDEYAACDGLALADLIRSGAVAASEVEAAAREAVARVNPHLNALAAPLFEQALAHNPKGVFGGVPFLIKDSGLRAGGVPMAMGSRLAGDGLVADGDDDLMVRFRSAGFATLGRTAVPEFSFNVSTESVVNGPTHNPWDPQLSAGGSTGGTAAMVAAGAVPVGHASDAGGSIRIPAACCGLVGLKPTRGRTPVGPTVGESVGGCGIDFALTRTLRDAAALLDLVSGAGVGERYAIAPPERSYFSLLLAEEDVAPLRVFALDDASPDTPGGPSGSAAVTQAATSLEAHGHHLVPAQWQAPASRLEDALVTVWASGLARQAAWVSRSTGRPITPESCEAVTLAGVARGRSLTALDLLEAHDAMNEVTRAVAQFFLSVDLLVTPALAEAPAPLGRFDYDDPSYGVTDWLATITTYAPMMAIFNVSGNPAMVLPIGRPANGPPASVQLVAPYGREDILFRAAAQLQHDSPLEGCLPAIHAAAGNAAQIRPHAPRGSANRLTSS